MKLHRKRANHSSAVQHLNNDPSSRSDSPGGKVSEDNKYKKAYGPELGAKISDSSHPPQQNPLFSTDPHVDRHSAVDTGTAGPWSMASPSNGKFWLREAIILVGKGQGPDGRYNVIRIDWSDDASWC